MLMKTLFAIVLLICSFPACTFAKYVLPEQFGAKGDGISDDTRPFMEAINTGLDISLNNKTVYSLLLHFLHSLDALCIVTDIFLLNFILYDVRFKQ